MLTNTSTSGHECSMLPHGPSVWPSRDLSLPLKKTLSHPKRDEELREEFRFQIALAKGAQRTIVYLDESGFAVDMPRTHGYSLKGQRCHGEQDWHARGRINAIGAIIGRHFLTVGLFECGTDSDVFYGWLTQDLIPKLPEESIVVMDNAAFHKRSDMVEALEKEGHIVLYLPPYSPDLNPIEPKWAHCKHLRRRYGCSVRELFLCPELCGNIFV